MKAENRKRVALVIGSGAVKCAASLGLWKVFLRENLGIALAVGSSGGSLYIAALALGFNLKEAEQMTFDFWSSDLTQGYSSNLRATLSGEALFTERSGFADDQHLNKILVNIFGDKTFNDVQFPVYIVATDLLSGESVVINQGKIVDAVRASIAIPLVFPPWEVGSQLLIDGAVSNPLPIDVAIKEGGEVIVAMGFEQSMRNRLRSYTAFTTHLNNLYMNNILKSTFAFYNLAHHEEIIPILPNFNGKIGVWDAETFPQIIEAGKQATEDQMPYLRRLLAL